MASYDITRVAGNIGALNSLNSLENINKQLATHQARLASGKRINSAADDPAGLSIATKLNTRSEALKTALSNIGDAQNLLSVAESGMSKINDILTEMHNKAQQGSSDTMGDTERQALSAQMTAYAQQIQDTVDQTQWNGKKLLNGLGDFGGAINFQTGADSSNITSLSGLSNVGVAGLGLGTANATATQISITNSASGALTTPVYNPAGATNPAADALGPGNYTLHYDATAHTIALYNGNSSTDPTALMRIASAAGNGTTAGLSQSGVNLAAAGTTPVAVDLGNGVTFSVGTNVTANTDFSFSISPTSASVSLTYDSNPAHLLTGATGLTSANFQSFMNKLETAQTTVSGQLANLGSMEGRLDFKSDQVTNDQANVEASYNRIMNADMASEQVSASKLSILQQTSTAMLAQANSAPQFLLSLFR